MFIPTSLGYCTQPHKTSDKKVAKNWHSYSCKNVSIKDCFKCFTHQHTYSISTHQSCLHPRDPDGGLVGLLSVHRQRQNGCQATQPSNLLGSLELSDIWPTWLAMIHKGDHSHNPLWPLLSCCNKYQTGLTHFQTSSHFCLSHILHFSVTHNQKLTGNARDQGSRNNNGLRALQPSYEGMSNRLHIHVGLYKQCKMLRE